MDKKEFFLWGVPIQFCISFFSLPEFNIVERIIYAICASIFGWIFVYKITDPIYNRIVKNIRPIVHTAMEYLRKILKIR